jgi:hypothetical protein
VRVRLHFGRFQKDIGRFVSPKISGTNPTTFEFTTATPALYVIGYIVFSRQKKIFMFSITHWATSGVVNLQRWRCKFTALAL